MTRIEKAIELFNKGFQTKADQKRALDYVSRGYDEVRRVITNGLLELRSNGLMSDEEMQPLYWGIPFNLHQFRPKHSVMLFKYFPSEIQEIERLVELRNEIKSALIVKVVSDTKELEEKVTKIEKSLSEIFKTNMEQYERGLAIGRLFNGLPVNVTPHWVFRDGGQFIRYFYFMNGKLIALNTIIAVMQTLEDEKEITNT